MIVTRFVPVNILIFKKTPREKQILAQMKRETPRTFVRILKDFRQLA